MDGMQRAVGAGTLIEWEGKKYVLDGMTLEDYGILKNYYTELKRQERIDFVLKLESKLPKETFQKHLDRAIEEASVLEISLDELDVWLNSIDGGTMSLWLLLDRRYPGQLSYSDMHKALAEEHSRKKLDALIDSRNAATGVDRAGN